MLEMKVKSQEYHITKLTNFIHIAQEKKMDILGLMAIPPNDNKTEEYFKSLSELNSSLGLKGIKLLVCRLTI